MEVFRHLKREADGFFEDLTTAVYPKNCTVLTNEEVDSLCQFMESCRALIRNAKLIVAPFPPREELLQVLHDIECVTTQVEKDVQSGMFGRRTIVQAAAIGASTGFLVGTPTMTFDLGFLTAIGSIAGGITGARTEAGRQSEDVKILVKKLEFLIQSIKNLKELVLEICRNEQNPADDASNYA